MTVAIFTEIWGTTAAVHKLAKQLGDSCTLVDPYGGNDPEFFNEQAAYEYFQQHVGVSQYAEIIAQYLSTAKPPSMVIGFSVGASALWSCLTQPPAQMRHASIFPKQAILFYGSQIRHMQLQSPTIPTQVVLPKSEPHFNIDDLEDRFRQLNNVSICKSDYLHGFMNELSDNYRPEAYAHYCALLRAAIMGSEPSSN